jgi:UTP-glucose-1-phosphate uridylyltransferase
VLLLGDHIYASFLLQRSDSEGFTASQTACSCVQQVLNVFERYGKSAAGLKLTSSAEVHHYGCASGNWSEGNIRTRNIRIQGEAHS